MIVTMRASHTSPAAFSFPATSTEATAAANSGMRLPPQSRADGHLAGRADGEIMASYRSP